MLRYFLALSIMITPAFAADQKSMTIGEASDIFEGLTALDGYKDVCKDGGNEKECVKHYKFAPGALTSIALDLTALRPIKISFDQSRNALIAQYGGTVADKDKAAWLVDEEKLRSAKAPQIVFSPLSQKDLNLDSNPIPPSVLALILPALGPD